MAIASLNDYIASAKQKLVITKTAARSSSALMSTSVFDLAGMPGAGVLAGTNTANGVVPSAEAGYPTINPFAINAKGYVSRVQYANTVPCRMALYDRLFMSGAHSGAGTLDQVLSAQPSFVDRIPGSDYNGLELWIEAVTAFTGSPTLTITYTNQNGLAAQVTTYAVGSAPIQGRCLQVPLAAGDTGIQKIERVQCSGASAGTFNMMILRPLYEARVKLAGDGDIADMLKTGMPVVYATSALYCLVTPDGTSTGTPSMIVEVASK